MYFKEKVILMLLFNASAIFSYDTPFGKIVKDFLDIQRIPSKILAYLCFENGKENFMKSLSQYSISMRNINDTKIEILDKQHHQLFILDADCHAFQEFLHKADNLNLFRAPFRWVVLTSNNQKIPENLNILVDSQFYIINKTSTNKHTIKSIYKTSKDHEFLENDIAIWDDHFFYYNHLNIPTNRSNLMGLKLNVSGVMSNPNSMTHLWDYRDKHIDTITKHNFLLTHYVLETLNATANFWFKTSWGYKNQSTGIYDGMVGDLQQGYAELGGTAAFFTPDRVDIIEYIAPTTKTRANFIFRAPPLSYVTNVYTLPFGRSVWHASFLLIGLISIVIFLIIKWEWRDEEFRKTLQHKHNVLRPNFLDVLVLELGAICQQGSEAEPKSGAGKIATLFVFVALMFLYTSYSANIVALLQSTSDNINTIEDLLNSRMKLGVELTPYSKYYFQIATDPVRKAVYEQKIAPKETMVNFMDIQTGIQRVREEFFGFHVEASNGYRMISETYQENEKCGLKGIEFWQVIDPWVAIKKTTSYKELFKVTFRKLHETGVQNREYRKLYTGKPTCLGTGSNFMSVGIIDCYYAFLIFGIGTVVSLILLALEKIVNRKRERIEQTINTAKDCIKRQSSF